MYEQIHSKCVEPQLLGGGLLWYPARVMPLDAQPLKCNTPSLLKLYLKNLFGYLIGVEHHDEEISMYIIGLQASRDIDYDIL